MPTARELLEQAEALMQRGRGARMNDDIPTLTDSVPTPLDGIVGGAGFEMRRAPTSLDDIPMLTEAVEDFDTPSIPLAQALNDELAMWRETEAASVHVSTAAATSVAADAPALQQAARLEALTGMQILPPLYPEVCSWVVPAREAVST